MTSVAHVSHMFTIFLQYFTIFPILFPYVYHTFTFLQYFTYCPICLLCFYNIFTTFHMFTVFYIAFTIFSHILQYVHTRRQTSACSRGRFRIGIDILRIKNSFQQTYFPIIFSPTAQHWNSNYKKVNQENNGKTKP